MQPVKTFPVIKDLVTDVSWNYRQKKRIPPFRPRPRDADGNYRMMQEDVDRIQEFRKCIECYLCQDVCHVLRDQKKQNEFVGPRFMIYLANLEMHPLDTRRSHRRPSATTSAPATATSPSAAPTSARSTSTSPTTASSRSRSGWSTATTTRSPACCAAASKKTPAPALDPDASPLRIGG